jgi:endo-1,4-beta-xylanase
MRPSSMPTGEKSQSAGASYPGSSSNTRSGGPYLDVATGLTNTTYTKTGLTAGTTYYYVLVARTATSESPNSPVASATAQ